MLNANFINCINEAFQGKGLNKKRKEELAERINGFYETYIQEGVSDVDAMRTARDRVVAEYEQILREKARKVSAQIKRIASDKKRVTDIRANLIEQRGGEDTERLGKALAFYGTVSKIEATPNRVGAGTSYHTRKEATKGLLSSVMGNHLVKVSKGALHSKQDRGNAEQSRSRNILSHAERSDQRASFISHGKPPCKGLQRRAWLSKRQGAFAERC